MKTSLYILFLLFLLFLTGQSIFAQDLPVMRSMEKPYLNRTRNKSGAPGNLYWQNKGDYQIRVNFNPATRELSGSVGIDYLNNSPDTLKTLVFKLYLNLYKANSMRNMPVATGDLTNGVHISYMALGEQELDSTKRKIIGTNMYVKGTVLPKQKLHIDISYSYNLNKSSFIRTGQIDSGAFFVAYFFPRVAVYDDIDGWNEHPYIGKEEFYNDYGNFQAEITVPGNYQVWATGELKNTEEVYEPKFVQRIRLAEKTDTVIDVITFEDLIKKQVTKHQPTNTWKFDANGVTDLAFAISNHYVWKAGSVLVDPVMKRRARVDGVFNPEHQAYVPVAG